ncbi:MAG: KpsF/GutQ family sugar-phosphate isomerase [Holophagales bacterium]|nr:KpsF/GutQ family sugar-phosphate isomerase [Holophagales bacterium]MYF94014.1 KpsF/GutQ family sugar-phosphate isomerase [Holophagales bacterium]
MAERVATAAGGERSLEIARKVLEIEAAAIEGLIEQLGDDFAEAVRRMRDCRGRVVCTGMGKSGHVMKKVAATLSSTGTPALFIHPAEAIHGDLGMIVPGDVVLAASSSGGTEELLKMIDVLHRRGVPLIAITGAVRSTIAERADLHLSAAIDQEACPLNLAPTASTTATLALGDALAMALLEARGFTLEDFATLHPGGELGRRLMTVEQVMHRGDSLPRVGLEAALREALFEMTEKSFGITAVIDDAGGLCGVISDGDLRRLLNTEPAVGASGGAFLDRSVGHYMTPDPKRIPADALVTVALEAMERHRITSLFICHADGRLEGLVHIHDLWGLRRK